MWVKIDIQDNKTAFDKELHFVNRFGYYFPVYLPLKKILLSMKAIALTSRAKARDMYDFSYLIPQAKMDFNHVKNDLLKRGINITSPGILKIKYLNMRLILIWKRRNMNSPYF
jgi:predicted nucleotidyltransferase component of viral defense system